MPASELVIAGQGESGLGPWGDGTSPVREELPPPLGPLLGLSWANLLTQSRLGRGIGQAAPLPSGGQGGRGRAFARRHLAQSLLSPR